MRTARERLTFRNAIRHRVRTDRFRVATRCRSRAAARAPRRRDADIAPARIRARVRASSVAALAH